MILLTVRRRTTVAALTLLSAGTASAALATPCDAQIREEREVRIMRDPGGRVAVLRGGAANRAVLGVTLAEGSRADTAGVRLESVDPESPAAKAGLKAGDIITEINGVSLKVAKQDAEDLALAGLAQRRLQRVMSNAKPGDEVKLQVRSGGSSRALVVKTASADELERRTAQIEERVITRGPDGVVTERRSGGAPRGAVGVSIGSSGTVRDTLGLFISSVVSGGAAEKAGIIEGERIASVNGVDVRVPREDVEDAQSASARVDRFVREIQQSEPGKAVALRVWGNGRYRDVSVTVQKAAELPGGVMIGGGAPQIIELRREGPSRGRLRINGSDIEFDGTGIERAMEEMGRRLQDRFREVEIDVRGLRTLPERSGVLRVRSGRTAV